MRIRHYGSIPPLGLEVIQLLPPIILLRYIVSTPDLFSSSGKKYPIWIMQDGDGNVRFPFPFALNYVSANFLSKMYGVIIVYPELRREVYSDDLPKYCSLDFFHRIQDLHMLVDEIKKIDFVDISKIFLIGLSAGADIVTLTSNERKDIAGVVTIGGGLTQLMSYLQDTHTDDWTEAAMTNVCSKSTFHERSGIFWKQLLYSNLLEEIKKSQIPYLAVIGSEDPIFSSDLQKSYRVEIEANKSDFYYEVIQGMGHGPGFSRKVWQLVSSWTSVQRVPRSF